MKAVAPLLILFAGFNCLAQSPSAQSSALSPAFEVASIKPIPQPARVMDQVTLGFLKSIAYGSRNGRFDMEGIASSPLSVLIQLAYDVRDFQIRGIPSWGNSERYAIIAKANDSATFEQMRPMLRSLLADRFQLRFHRETRELPVYELTAAKGGLKIAASKAGSCIAVDRNNPPPPFDPNKPRVPPCGGIIRGINSIEAGAISMPKFVAILSDEVGRTVVDRSGFTDTFNLHLNFVHDVLTNGDPGAEAGTSIFIALQDQLGLRLESTRGPVEVLVIDRVERPSEN